MLRRPLRFVALGDSYTIGTSVAAAERWPDQLVERLARSRPQTPPLVLSANLALDGRTSADVLTDQLPRLWASEPGFVSLLIGVNDVVQRVPIDAYRSNVGRILDALLERLPPVCVLTVSTPDYTVTPRGAEYGQPAAQSAAIRAVNIAMAEASAARSIAHVNVHDLSLRALDDRSLVARDGLHPSAAQYALWVDRIAPPVLRLTDADQGRSDI